MAKNISTFCLVALFFISLFTGLNAAELVLGDTPVKVCFSPGGSCTAEIITEIDKAKREVLVQAYSFTSSPIRSALIRASNRGVRVEVILDRGEQVRQKHLTSTILKKSGVPVYIDDKHVSAHNKVMVIDEETVITGSFNFTYSAESKNAENVITLKSSDLARVYTRNWSYHKDHSRRY